MLLVGREPDACIRCERLDVTWGAIRGNNGSLGGSVVVGMVYEKERENNIRKMSWHEERVKILFTGLGWTDVLV